MFRDLVAVDSDPDTVKSACDCNGSYTAWYINYYGEYASIYVQRVLNPPVGRR